MAEQPRIDSVSQQAFTGEFPSTQRAELAIKHAFDQISSEDDGTVADYIPILAAADPSLFGISVIETTGEVHEIGDWSHQFSIQSISKMFVYALAIEQHGRDFLHQQIGVNNTGLPFNSVMAIELNGGHPMNPMVNAGAIATTALINGRTSAEKWETIREGLSAFAGRSLSMSGEVYHSEASSNDRNKALARLLASYERMSFDPLEIVDIYTRQCAVNVSTHDIAVMGATLADGGVNPITGQRVVSEETCRDTLAVTAATGLYEGSGDWLFNVGLPAKSGVAGGIVAVTPGKCAIGAFSPPLDGAGNSVRAQRAIGFLSKALGLNVFASRPHHS